MDVLVRIFVGESDEYEGRPLYEEIVKFLREKGISGATALRAVLGYGTTGKLHYEGVEVLSYDLPVVIEFVDEEEKAEQVLRDMKPLLKEGTICIERVSKCRL